jgi:hypothetical protein
MLNMERRLFLENLLTGFVIGFSRWLAVESFAQPLAYMSYEEKARLEKKTFEILKEIHREVKELGKFGKEDFINREFYLDLDGNEVNSEEHVNVLIYNTGEEEKMVLQVTYFEPENRVIKYAKEIRSIVCRIKGEKVEVEKCDYDEKQMKSLLPDILKEIRHEKELLKKIDRKN